MLLFCVVTCLNAQNNRFIYEYTYISDSLSNVKSSEIIRLDIINEKSVSYGEKKFKFDSIRVENSKKGIREMTPPSEKFYSDMVIKNIFESKITYLTYLANNKLIVDENNEFIWKLLPNYSLILGYKVQEAETTFRGRTWRAWFSSDLPISDGPYKFRGLPGLIFKVYDTTCSHKFEIISIKNIDTYVFPEVRDYIDKIEVNYSSYQNLFKKNRDNPVAHLIGKIPDYYDADGNFVSGTLKLREIEKIDKEEIKKNNNILEIDLIKR